MNTQLKLDLVFKEKNSHHQIFKRIFIFLGPILITYSVYSRVNFTRFKITLNYFPFYIKVNFISNKF